MRNILLILFIIIGFNSYSKEVYTSDSLLKPVICQVSVDTDSYAKIMNLYWLNVDTNAKRFIIFRKNINTSNFDSVGIVVAKHHNQFRDSTDYSWPLKRTYKIKAVNDSGIKSDYSEEKSNIYLDAFELVDDWIVRLTWDKVYGQNQDSIIIWRKNIIPRYEFIKVNTVSINDTIYYDSTQFLIWGSDYYLEILKNDSCILNDQGKYHRIFSNISSVFFGSVNNTNFSKIEVYPNPSDQKIILKTKVDLSMYKMQVYNSLGQLMIETYIRNNEVDVQELPVGIYRFIINNNNQQYIGTFSVVR